MALIEVAVQSVADAGLAVSLGAGRLEVSVGLEVGGLTPTAGLVRACVREAKAGGVPVVALVRPRVAGFVYDDATVRLMAEDAAALLDAGADAVAFGALTAAGGLDERAWDAVCGRVGAARVVAHRAVDAAADGLAVLRALAARGVRSALTSGGEADAAAGAAAIARWREALERDGLGDAMTLVPAGGVRAGNVAAVLRETGCVEVHGTFSVAAADDAGPVGGAAYRRLDGDALRAAVLAVG